MLCRGDGCVSQPAKVALESVIDQLPSLLCFTVMDSAVDWSAAAAERNTAAPVDVTPRDRSGRVAVAATRSVLVDLPLPLLPVSSPPPIAAAAALIL